MEDLMTVVTSFIAHIYGRRSKKYKGIVKTVEGASKTLKRAIITESIYLGGPRLANASGLGEVYKQEVHAP